MGREKVASLGAALILDSRATLLQTKVKAKTMAFGGCPYTSYHKELGWLTPRTFALAVTFARGLAFAVAFGTFASSNTFNTRTF